MEEWGRVGRNDREREKGIEEEEEAGRMTERGRQGEER